jgi:hypothetical protein
MCNQGFLFREVEFEPFFEETAQLFLDCLRLCDWPDEGKSGSQGTLLPLGPLRTGRVPLKTSGSSTSRTPRLLVLFLLLSFGVGVFFCQFCVVELLAVTHGPLRLGMDVLVTEQMNQC